jgi:hypothetical protein
MMWYSSDTVMALHGAKTADMRSSRVTRRQTSRARSAAIRRRSDVVMVQQRSIVAV